MCSAKPTASCRPRPLSDRSHRAGPRHHGRLQRFGIAGPPALQRSPAGLRLAAGRPGGPQLPFRISARQFDAWLRGAAAGRSVLARSATAPSCWPGLVCWRGKPSPPHWNDAAGAGGALSLGPGRSRSACTCRTVSSYTSAGVTAGIDLSLYLLAQDHGAGSGLERGQAPGGVHPALGRAVAVQSVPYAPCRSDLGGGVGAALRAGQSRLADLTIADLARAANMSARNFSRVFAREAKRHSGGVRRARAGGRGAGDARKHASAIARPWPINAAFAMPSTCAACSTAASG